MGNKIILLQADMAMAFYKDGVLVEENYYTRPISQAKIDLVIMTFTDSYSCKKSDIEIHIIYNGSEPYYDDHKKFPSNLNLLLNKNLITEEK